jgi:hypothetical protein
MRRPLRLRVLLGLAAVLPAACSWGVPADPGRNASERSGPPASPATDGAAAAGAPRAPAADEGARALYLDRCGRCHAPFPPEHASAAAWPALVRRYGPRAGLFGAERERVLAWLVERAR